VYACVCAYRIVCLCACVCVSGWERQGKGQGERERECVYKCVWERYRFRMIMFYAWMSDKHDFVSL